MKEYIVYVHINKKNNKKYFGITCQSAHARWKKNGIGYILCPVFWKAICKYGWDGFLHKILFEHFTKELACNKLIQLIKENKTTDRQYGYNVSKGGDSNNGLTMRLLWSNLEYKNDLKNRMKNAWLDESKRKNRSLLTKKRHLNPLFKLKFTQAIRLACGRKVRCIETQKLYNTLKDALRLLCVNHSNICRSIKTGRKCGGYHWLYV